MTSTPVEDLAETLVELADALVGEFDLGGFLRLLANRCVRLLGADAAGLLLIDHEGQKPAVGVSDERVELLGLADDGPGVDCHRTGEPVVVSNLADASLRWPRFVAAAASAGFAAVHAVPLRRRTEVLGTLSLLRVEPGEFDRSHVRIARAVADLATIGLLQVRAVRRQEQIAAQLQHALHSRVVIEQAKGVIAERLGLGMAAAFEALRKYARSHNTRVGELAASVVDGTFDTGRLPR